MFPYGPSKNWVLGSVVHTTHVGVDSQMPSVHRVIPLARFVTRISSQLDMGEKKSEKKSEIVVD